MEDLLKKLQEKGVTLGSVESITGGLFASTMTAIPGASKVFKGALVTYTAEEKIRLAKVSQDTIDEYGVVSDEVAIEMAEGGKRALKVDYCVSVTGNAGPTCEPGGKPVGEVHIAVATKFGTVCQKFLFKGNRKHIQSMCVRKMIQFVSNSLTF